MVMGGEGVVRKWEERRGKASEGIGGGERDGRRVGCNFPGIDHAAAIKIAGFGPPPPTPSYSGRMEALFDGF